MSRSLEYLFPCFGFVLTVRATPRAGILNLVDLAGSERLKKSASEGQRKTEAVHINSSLTALGKVWVVVSRIIGYIPVEKNISQVRFQAASTTIRLPHLINTVNDCPYPWLYHEPHRSLRTVCASFVSGGGDGTRSQLRVDACSLPGLEADASAAELSGRQQLHGGTRNGTPYCPVRCLMRLMLPIATNSRVRRISEVLLLGPVATGTSSALAGDH